MVNILHRVQVIFGQTGAENIGRGFQQISQYGQQANTTIGQANANLGTFSQEATAAGSGVSIFGKSMGTLGGSTTQAAQGISIFNTNLAKTTGGLTSANTLVGTSITQQKSFGKSILDNSQSFATMAVGISTTIQSVVGLGRAFRDMNDQQLGVDRAAKKLSQSNEAVEKGQRKLNELAAAGKKGTQEWSDAIRDQTQNIEGQKIAVTNLGEKQEQLRDTQENLVFLTVSTVIGTIGTAISAFNSFGLKLDQIIPKIKSFGGAMKGLPALMGGMGGLVAGPLLGAVGGALLTDMATKVQQQLDAVAKTYDPKNRKGAIFSLGDPKAMDTYQKQFTENQETMNKAGISGIDMLSDYFLHTTIVADKLKLLDEEQKKVTSSTTGTGAATAGATTGYNALATSSSALVNKVVVLRTEFEKTQDITKYSAALAALKIPPEQLIPIMAEVDAIFKKGIVTTNEAAAATAKLTPIEMMLKQAKEEQIAKGIELAQTNFLVARSNEDMNKTVAASAEGAKKGVAQFEALRDTTIGNQQAEKLYRSALIEVLQPLNKGIDLTKMSTAELTLRAKAAWGDIDATKELNKVYAENATFVTDMANKYGAKLNPAMQLTTKQIQEATAAFAAYDAAVKKLEDPKELFGLKPFKIKFDMDKEFSEFIKDLPKGLRGDIIMTVKSKSANENVKQLMAAIAGTALQIPAEVQLKRGDAGANKFVDETVDQIKELFEKKGKNLSASPQVQTMINKLLEIKKAPDSWPKLMEYFKSPEFLATISAIDPQTAAIITALTGGTPAITIPIAISTEEANTSLGELAKNAGSAWTAVSDMNDALENTPDVSKTVAATATAADGLTKSTGSAWTATEDLNESLEATPDNSGVVSTNSGAMDDLTKSAGSAWNATEDMNDALDNTPNVSSTINKNAKAMDNLAKSAGSAWNAIEDVNDALDDVDGKSVKATVEVEFKATGDQIAIDKAKAGGQYGQMFISNSAAIWKGKRISEFNKPELNITIPLSRNPSNITMKDTANVPTGAGSNLSGLIGGGGGGNSQILQLRIDGNGIVRDSDLYFSVIPQMGRRTGQYSH
jgi:hypothetical protein